MSEAFGPFAPDPDAIAFWDAPPDATVGGNGDTGAGSVFRPLLYGEGALYRENPWEVVQLGGEKLPGLCTIKCEPQLQIDQQKGPKHDGAILTLHGTLPCPIEITVTMWTAAQWARFVELIPLWWRKPQKDPKALAAFAASHKISARDAKLKQAASFIYHPALTPFGITQVVVRGVSLPEDGPMAQSKVVRIKCIEYSPPTTKAPPTKIVAQDAEADERVVTPTIEPPSKTGVGPRG